MAVQVLGALGVDLLAFRARAIAETESPPEGLEYSPSLRVRKLALRTAMPTRSRPCSTRSTTG